jgi:hypothetical protein
VSALLLVCFAPSLVTIRAWTRVPEVFSQSIPVRRGMWVTKQVAEPFVEIDDPIHKIVRWRLLMPLVGHELGLAPGVVLALAPVGCVVVLALLIGLGRARGLPWSECAMLAVVAGASSWFFTSTGWLGYYDSWLVFGLLVVAWVPSRWLLWLACVLTPWIDERFVLGFPLAILVRVIVRGLATEAGVACLLIAGYVALRLRLAGQAGSMSLAEYWQAIDARIPAWRFVFGAWEGLRAGWILALAAPLILVRRQRVLAGLLLAAGIVVTTVTGLASANDLSRAMAPVVPVVPLGWELGRTGRWWIRGHVGPILVGMALLLPANLVVSTFTLPVNQLWYEVRLLMDPPPPFAPGPYLQQAKASLERGDRERARAFATVGLGLAPVDSPTATAAAELLRSLQ